MTSLPAHWMPPHSVAACSGIPVGVALSECPVSSPLISSGDSVCEPSSRFGSWCIFRKGCEGFEDIDLETGLLGHWRVWDPVSVVGEPRRLPAGDGCVSRGTSQNVSACFLLLQWPWAPLPCPNTLLPVPHSHCIPGDVLQLVCWGSALRAGSNVSAHPA